MSDKQPLLESQDEVVMVEDEGVFVTSSDNREGENENDLQSFDQRDEDDFLSNTSVRSYTENGFISLRLRKQTAQNRLDLQRELFTLHTNLPPITKEQQDFVQIVESLDYDDMDNEVERDAVNEKRVHPLYKHEGFERWVLTFVIGFLTACVAFGIDIGVESIKKAKYSMVFTLIQQYGVESWTPALAFIFTCVALVAVAGILVAFIEPVAAGSGIPEIKCYLNGIKIPKVVRIRTLLGKAVGVLFSVAGGLAIGKEGPMIHSGAIIAAGVPQGKSSTFDAVEIDVLENFRNDHEKRDFVSSGAAAGVAAAFGAPIGGILFSLEEGASFWDQKLTWRTFFCSMVSTFTLNVLLSATRSDVGDLSNPGLINFGVFDSKSNAYRLQELPAFVLLGVIGGVSGALFNYVNTKVTVFRTRHIHTPKARFIEVLAIALLSAIMHYVVPIVAGSCIPFPEDLDALETTLLQFNCKDGYYNDMAGVLFATSEEAIKRMFHADEIMSVTTLIVFFFVYWSLAVITYGIAVPSGLFVPSLLTGCAYGRLLGQIMMQVFPDLGVHAGSYALIGAASQLAGTVRMTISLTVIILESTNDIRYLLPLMVTIMVAKWVGDLFNLGIYDIHIEIKHIPFLEFFAPQTMHILRAEDVMSKQVVKLSPISTVDKVMNILESTPHNGFPVVKKTKNGDNKLVGIVLRSQLITLLHNEQFFENEREAISHPILSWRDFQQFYPRFKKVEELNIAEGDRDKLLYLTPYMNPCPYTVSPITPLKRVFRLFRTMGLRHLICTDTDHRVVGIITRKCLSFEACRLAIQSLEQET